MTSFDEASHRPLAVVIGGTGLLGGHLCQTLLTQGWSVRSLSRSGSAPLSTPLSAEELEMIDFQAVDILDEEALYIACEGADALYHLAGRVSRHPQDSGALHQLHIQGTNHFLSVAARREIGLLLYLSTSGVSGVSKRSLEADEETPYARELIADWAYYQSKLFAEEEVLRACERGLPVKIARPSLLLGPGDPTGQSHEDLLLFLSGQLKAVPPGGLNAVDVRDVASFLPILMERGEVGIGYMIGGTNLSARSLINQIAQITDRPPPLLDLPLKATKRAMGPLKWLSAIPMFGGIDPQTFEMACHYWYINNERAISLGFTPRPLSDTLLAALRDLKSRGFYHD
jgi:dihydroflavonol-4-reductase